jgi:hypothetical protein
MNAKKILKWLLFALLPILLLNGCATTPRQPQFLAPDFPEAGICIIHLPPVSFEAGYEPPYDIDLDGELRQQLRTVLESKGYQVDPTPEGAGNHATLWVHVDFLFISETFGDREPPPVIDFQAAASLVSAKGGRELWRDRGGGWVGGTGGTRISYPTADRYLALSLLADHLLATFPNAVRR